MSTTCNDQTVERTGPSGYSNFYGNEPVAWGYGWDSPSSGFFVQEFAGSFPSVRADELMYTEPDWDLARVAVTSDNSVALEHFVGAGEKDRANEYTLHVDGARIKARPLERKDSNDGHFFFSFSMVTLPKQKRCFELEVRNKSGDRVFHEHIDLEKLESSF